MLVDGQEFGQLDFNFFNAAFGVKAFLILFLFFYLIFSIILYRQIQIMNKKIPTKLAPILRFFGIVHMGVSAAVLFLVIGNF